MCNWNMKIILPLTVLFFMNSASFAQLRQGEVGGELAAAVPDGPAVLSGVIWQADRVSSDLARVDCAVPLAHEDPGLLQPAEELLFRARPGRRGTHLPAQGD